MQFSQRLVYQFQLHTGVVVDIVVIGKDFFDIFFEFFYFILEFGYSVCMTTPCSVKANGKEDFGRLAGNVITKCDDIYSNSSFAS